MVLEAVMLTIQSGQTSAFEAAFAEARPIITAAPGCQSCRLERCLENDQRYLLLVEWRTIEDHMQGFRGSPDYLRWKALLHHFYEQPIEVLHYRRIAA
jgi:heme-degrading monooxygenase HmoA